MQAAPITSIRELLQELLRHRDPEAYGEILLRYAIPTNDLEPYFRWNTRHYTRTCIHRNEEFELLVICYEQEQRTSVHDYDSQLAWIHPVMGEVLEERFALVTDGGIRRTSEVFRQPGEVDRISEGTSIRRFTNVGPGRAVTVNLYAKPMSKWRVYDERTGATTITPPGPAR